MMEVRFMVSPTRKGHDLTLAPIGGGSLSPERLVHTLSDLQA